MLSARSTANEGSDRDAVDLIDLNGVGRRARWKALELIVLKPVLENRVFHDVDPAGDTELLHRIRLMCFDSFNAQIHAAGDLFIAVAKGDKFQHLDLAAGKLLFPFAPERGGAPAQPHLQEEELRH